MLAYNLYKYSTYILVIQISEGVGPLDWTYLLREGCSAEATIATRCYPALRFIGKVTVCLT
jgi:hypothetical protein